MQSSTIWHSIAVIIAILALLVTTYTTILINNFKTPETTDQFFANSNTYYYISEIVKTDVRAKYSPELRTNIIKLAVADNLLNAIMTPNLVARVALPVLQARAKLVQLPTSFAGNNLVLNTKQYTDQLTATINSFQLPSQLQDAANTLIASVPPQITIVNAHEHPNSILASITKTRIFFDNVKIIRTIAGVLLILSLVVLLLMNLQRLKRFTAGLIWLFGITGILMLLSFWLSNPLAQAISNNTDPVTGVLQDQLVEHIVTYYFSQTQTLSIVFIILAIGLYILYHFVPYQKFDPFTSQRVPRSRPRKRPV